jgi:quinol-cytochrome oxidoreductase complex cytochrome b subunit
MRILFFNRLSLIVYKLGFSYPVPVNLTYFWNFGSLALFFFFVQVISGVFLAMYYVPDIAMVFFAMEHLMRDVSFGWLVRYIHANGASFFFFFVYLHLFRNLYFVLYRYPRSFLWFTGIIILFLMVVTAFLGYVLPWGQMSFWAATVITNFSTSIPVFGFDLAFWLWGGYSIDNPTLNRFYSIHYFLPFLIFFFICLHIFYLHEFGSSNSLNLVNVSDVLPFTPFFVLKDLVGVLVALFIFFFVCFFIPNIFGHPDNYIVANSLVTPTHIVPEWYFLAMYGLLRSVPEKLLGIVSLVSFFLVLISLCILDDEVFMTPMVLSYVEVVVCFWIFGVVFLTWLGSKPVEFPYDYMTFLVTGLLYFFDFLFIVQVSVPLYVFKLYKMWYDEIFYLIHEIEGT